MQMLQANAAQISAASDAPGWDADHDLGVQLHQSVVANFARATLGGMTLTDEKLAELMGEATGEVPEELQITADKTPWSITFSSTRPVRATFSDSTFRIVIRGRQFTKGSQVTNENVDISAAYKMERTDAGAKLTRIGDVEITFVGREELATGQVVLRTFLRKKFDAMFEPEIASEGFELPNQWSVAGSVHLEQMQAQDGWLVLGWGLDEPPVNAQSDALATRTAQRVLK